jgi:gluconokinase
MGTIDLTEAQAPIVLAIDIGSSSVRALLYDRLGRHVEGSEAQHPHRQWITAKGGSEADPAELFDLVIHCVDYVADKAGGHRRPIAAVAMSSFWHGLMGLDEAGQPGSPVYMWSDKRSGPDAIVLGEEVDAITAHQRTGCRIHSSYWPAKLRWIAREWPEQFAGVHTWVSFTDYVHSRLFGKLRTSVSMASGTGMLNRAAVDWDQEMLDALGVAPSSLPAIVDRSEPYSRLVDAYATRWPSLRDVPWYPAIGDGAAANIGAGCIGSARIAMTIGTSAAMRLIVRNLETLPSTGVIPHRIWEYRLDREHRVLGGALSNGGNVSSWIAQQFAGGDFDSLTSAAEKIRPDAHGLTMLPLLAGERSPSWIENATGTISGLRLTTTAGELFRATMESTAYRLASIYDDLKLLSADDHEIHANGGAALSSPLWLQIIADTLGHSLDAVDAEAEASARGAALCALESLGSISSLGDIVRAVSRRYEPDPAANSVYRAGRNRQSDLEHAINGLSIRFGRED